MGFCSSEVVGPSNFITHISSIVLKCIQDPVIIKIDIISTEQPEDLKIIVLK
jgi:hypothetical protein